MPRAARHNLFTKIFYIRSVFYMTEYKKLSKKAQKAVNAMKRNNWGVTNPVTKIVKSKKCYDRKVFKSACYDF